MSLKQYRKLRDSVHRTNEVRDNDGRFLRSFVRYPRGRDYNRLHQAHVPRDPDVIMYHDRPANPKPPTIETRILGEALLIAHAMCRAGLLQVAGTRTKHFYDHEDKGSFFEEDGDEPEELQSISPEELDRLFREARHEVHEYNKTYGGLDYWNPVARRWETRKAQLGDEVQYYRDSVSDPTEFYGEEPKDPNERQDASAHKYDDRFQAPDYQEYKFLGEEYMDVPDPALVPMTPGQMARLAELGTIDCYDPIRGKWVLEVGTDDGSQDGWSEGVVWRFVTRKEIYEEQEAEVRRQPKVLTRAQYLKMMSLHDK